MSSATAACASCVGMFKTQGSNIGSEELLLHSAAIGGGCGVSGSDSCVSSNRTNGFAKRLQAILATAGGNKRAVQPCILPS